MSNNIEDAIELAVQAISDANHRAYAKALMVFAKSEAGEVIEALGNAVCAAAHGNVGAEIHPSALLSDLASSRNLLRAVIDIDTKALKEKIGDNYMEFEIDLISLAAALRQGSDHPQSKTRV